MSKPAKRNAKTWLRLAFPAARLLWWVSCSLPNELLYTIQLL
jgi:hypothetical protein